jgi:hypothetical protein
LKWRRLLTPPVGTVAAPAGTTGEPSRADQPRPFTPAEREDVTLLFGGLHWPAERIAQASIENLGYKVQVERAWDSPDTIKPSRHGDTCGTGLRSRRSRRERKPRPGADLRKWAYRR